jgi:cytochrome b561
MEVEGMSEQPISHYSGAAQVFHWLTAIVVLAAFIYGPGGSEERVYAAAQDFDRQLHETLGLCVLALVLLRLAWRVFDRHPEPAATKPWMNRAAKWVQTALYVLLFAVPLSAIVGAWLEGHPLTLLGGFSIPPAWGESHPLGATLADIHPWLGDAIIWLAGFHVAAALFHHYVLKDGVLRSMLPHRGEKGS